MICTYHRKGVSIAPSRKGTAVDVAPQRTLLAGKGVRTGVVWDITMWEGNGLLTSCANCDARFSSIIGATAAAGLNHQSGVSILYL